MSPAALLAQLQDQQHCLQQLDALHDEGVAAAFKIVHDPVCAPALLLTAQQTQQHPLWAAESVTWKEQHLQLPRQGSVASSRTDSSGGSSVGTQSSSNNSSNSSTTSGHYLPVQLPAADSTDITEEVQLPVAPLYAAAAAGTVEASISSHEAPAGVRAAGLWAWPVTASAAAAFLATPLGFVAQPLLQQVRLAAVLTAAICRCCWSIRMANVC